MIDRLMTTLWPVACWIFFASCKGIVVIAVVLFFRQCLAHWLSAQGRHRLWFAVLACLTVPFGLHMDLGLLSKPAAWVSSSHYIGDARLKIAEQPPQVIETASYGDNLITRSVELPFNQPLLLASSPTRFILISAWLAVMTALLACSIWTFLRYLRVKSSAQAIDLATTRLFGQCKAELGVRRDVRIVESAQIRSPAIFGCWSPTLLLPLGLSTRLNLEQLRHVFLHELAHVQRQDVLVNWLTTLVQIVHWFNPFVWYALRRMRDDMEQACDAQVLRQLSIGERVSYGNTLIGLADFRPEHGPLLQGVGIVTSYSQLKVRIQMIATFNPLKISFVRSLSAGCLLIAITSVGLAQPRVEQVPEPKTMDAKARLIDVPIDRPSAQSASASSISPSREITAEITREMVAPESPLELNPKPGSQKSKAPSPNNTNSPSATIADESLQSEYLRIKYLKVSDLATLLKANENSSFLSQRGSLAFDERTNTLLLQDTAKKLGEIRKMISALDIPSQQILVGMRLVVADDDLIRELTAGKQPLHTDLDAQLSAAVKSGRAEIVSEPKGVVENRNEMSFKQGVDLPHAVASKESAANVQFTKSMFTLKVTPSTTPNNRINLDLDIAREILGPNVTSMSGETLPSIDSRRIKTQVLMDDGQTIMLDQALNQPLTLEDKRQMLVLLSAKLLPKQQPRFP